MSLVGIHSLPTSAVKYKMNIKINLTGLFHDLDLLGMLSRTPRSDIMSAELRVVVARHPLSARAGGPRPLFP